MAIIKKGSHRSKRNVADFFLSQSQFIKVITFTPSCRYPLENTTHVAWNILFGAAFGGWPRRNSACFSWRYNAREDVIEIGSFTYVNGKCVDHADPPIARLKIGPTYTFRLLTQVDYYHFVLNGKQLKSIPHNKQVNWGYQISLHLGGSQRALHDIIVTIE